MKRTTPLLAVLITTSLLQAETVSFSSGPTVSIPDNEAVTITMDDLKTLEEQTARELILELNTRALKLKADAEENPDISVSQEYAHEWLEWSERKERFAALTHSHQYLNELEEAPPSPHRPTLDQILEERAEANRVEQERLMAEERLKLERKELELKRDRLQLERQKARQDAHENEEPRGAVTPRRLSLNNRLNSDDPNYVEPYYPYTPIIIKPDHPKPDVQQPDDRLEPVRRWVPAELDRHTFSTYKQPIIYERGF
ncbi:MAG: hypothetical protein SFY68_02290 [Candidatus Sumerlaeia bacterium]|nr:hypothetical protein [Candidatus Sumerlaeia bacterium]